MTSLWGWMSYLFHHTKQNAKHKTSTLFFKVFIKQSHIFKSSVIPPIQQLLRSHCCSIVASHPLLLTPGRCDGECRPTCTGDGRKWDTVAGAGGVRAVCVEDNILCNARDPYRGANNIMVHEFAHTIHMYGLPRTRDSAVSSLIIFCASPTQPISSFNI